MTPTLLCSVSRVLKTRQKPQSYSGLLSQRRIDGLDETGINNTQQCVQSNNIIITVINGTTCCTE
jgi:hypothetical protein